MTKKIKSNSAKTLEQKKANKRIYEILDLHSEAIEDGNTIFADLNEHIINLENRIEILEKKKLK